MASFIVKQTREHPSAPAFAPEDADDGLGSPELLEGVRAFEKRVRDAEADPGVAALILREAVQRTIVRARTGSAHYRRTLASAVRDARAEDLPGLPVLERAALAAEPSAFVPDGEDLGPLLAVPARASGAAPAFLAPHHPVALGSYAPLLRATLRRRRIEVDFGPDALGLARLASPADGGGAAPVPCAVGELRALDGAGFVSLDLGPAGGWRDPLDPLRFLAAFAPFVVAGSLAALDDLVRRVEDASRTASGAVPRPRPRALLCVNGDVPFAVRERWEKVLGGAPVVEWSSSIELGPFAYSCRLNRGHHILPPDLLVESPAERDGELLFTGGRNPYLPLVRYASGDRGTIDRGPCSCGDPSPRIVGLKRAT